MSLPRLREELELLPGPRLADGQPSWTLHDPVRNRFFNLDWPTLEILRRWSLDDGEAILAEIAADTTLHLETEDLERVVRFLVENQLVRPNEQNCARQFAERLDKLTGSRFKWLLHHYLFFRVPLVRPDAWLERWQGFAGWFYSRQFAALTLAALLLGLGQVIRHREIFIASLVDTFNWQGLLAYGVALIAVKMLHELGHAFTAKRFGCRIPSMGVAFLVLWPMAYTDTNDTWRLTSRWQRLQVASAGIVTELVVAAWATLAWAFLPDGALRSTAFVLATTSWIATLAINASPFMRFDGYFILSDALDMPNLHERSFALARWRLREWLFALGDPKPEIFSPRRELALTLFAWGVWVYRLVVFLGIAVLVYSFFIKLVGIFLFLVEIVWFLVLPVWHELKVWAARRSEIRASRRARYSGFVFAALLLLTVIPWPSRILVSGICHPAEIWPIFAPAGAQVSRNALQEGLEVEAGSVLIELAAPELASRIRSVQARVERLRWQAVTAGFDAESRARLQSSQEEMETAHAELASLREEAARYMPEAPFAGVVRDVDPDLAAGQWVAKNEKLAILVGRNGRIVETFVDEDAIKRVHLGDHGLFFNDSRSNSALALKVIRIDADATRVLPNRLLSVQSGGHILTRERRNQIVPEQAWYRVTLAVDEPASTLDSQAWRGSIVIRGSWQSPAWPFIRNAMAVLLRETGF